nr:MAG TPA_asm: hypothetical protein [Caudoviricetes sp.]
MQIWFRLDSSCGFRAGNVQFNEPCIDLGGNNLDTAEKLHHLCSGKYVRGGVEWRKYQRFAEHQPFAKPWAQY